MQQDIPHTDLKTLLTTYKNTLPGSSLLKFLRIHLLASESEAHSICVDLVSMGFLRSVGRSGSSSNGGRSGFWAGGQYQWKRLSLESSAESPVTKARRDVERADFDYRKAVKTAETTRLTFESYCVDFMNTLQHMEETRISLIKDSFVALNSAQMRVVPVVKGVFDRIQVLLETLQPERELTVMIERDRTGNCRVPPLLYVNLYGGVGDQVFGVALDDLIEGPKGGEARNTSPKDAGGKSKVPNIVRYCLKAIGELMNAGNAGNRGSRAVVSREEIDVWIEPNMNLSAVHALRNELNSRKIGVGTIMRFPVSVVVGVLKLYLIELPVSVCSSEIYEPLKLLYLSKSEDFDLSMRLNSLRSLLATLSSPHYYTLGIIAGHLNRTIAHLPKDDPRITQLAQIMGQIVLRPARESQVTMFDKHPARFMK
ncbi:hypothetical protein HK102_009124, partial [Quaeritorhiza haematococci]